jgi:hypothetical protein
MKREFPTMLAAGALSLFLGCHHAGASNLHGRVLARGGELGGVSLEDKKAIITNTTVSVWGVIEVPDGSRMQATYAGVDAITRSELLKLIRVRIQDEVVSVDSTDPARRDVYERTVESVAGSLRGAGEKAYGWERVQRGEQVVLRVWSRLSVPIADVNAALQAARAQP